MPDIPKSVKDIKGRRPLGEITGNAQGKKDTLREMTKENENLFVAKPKDGSSQSGRQGDETSKGEKVNDKKRKREGDAEEEPEKPSKWTRVGKRLVSWSNSYVGQTLLQQVQGEANEIGKEVDSVVIQDLLRGKGEGGNGPQSNFQNGFGNGDKDDKSAKGAKGKEGTKGIEEKEGTKGKEGTEEKEGTKGKDTARPESLDEFILGRPGSSKKKTTTHEQDIIAAGRETLIEYA